MSHSLSPDDDVSSLEDIARYVGFSDYDADANMVNGSAFDRKPKDTDGLSVNRCLHHANDQEQDDKAIRTVMASRLTLGKKAIFACLNVGDMLASLAEFEQPIAVLADPLEAEGEKLANPAHALISGLPFAGETIGSLRSEIVGDRLKVLVNRTFPAFPTPAVSEQSS